MKQYTFIVEQQHEGLRLDRFLADNLKDIEVLLTMIDGNIEYQKASHSFPKPCEIPTSPTSSAFLLAVIAVLVIPFTIYKKRKMSYFQ